MVITKLEYKFKSTDAYIELSVSGNSGSFSEKPQSSDAGISYTSEIKAYIANLSPDHDTVLKSLMLRKAIYKVSDSAGLIYEVGDDSAKASLTYEKINEGKPGAKHGYQLTISLKYRTPSVMQVL